MRFIPAVSGVQIPAPPPNANSNHRLFGRWFLVCIWWRVHAGENALWRRCPGQRNPRSTASTPPVALTGAPSQRTFSHPNRYGGLANDAWDKKQLLTRNTSNSVVAALRQRNLKAGPSGVSLAKGIFPPRVGDLANASKKAWGVRAMLACCCHIIGRLFDYKYHISLLTGN